jgi:hypothetical protein
VNGRGDAYEYCGQGAAKTVYPRIARGQSGLGKRVADALKPKEKVRDAIYLDIVAMIEEDVEEGSKTTSK